MGEKLKQSATALIWSTANTFMFDPMMKNHMVEKYPWPQPWQSRWGRNLLITLLVASGLNFMCKVLVQFIAVKFHLRTYADKIELNRLAIDCLIKLAIYVGHQSPGLGCSKHNIGLSKQVSHLSLSRSTKTTKESGPSFDERHFRPWNAQAKVLEALKAPNESRKLGEYLFCSLVLDCNNDKNEVLLGWTDMSPAFDSDEEAEHAFDLFDKDLNGDIAMDEFASTCAAIGVERKDIQASLSDIGEVVGKLEKMFMTLSFLTTMLISISLFMTPTKAMLASIGATLLTLSWILAASAQELFQAMIFVFIKHPFDVGDRIKIYGNTGMNLQGDEYFVKKVSLLYTEFRKQEGLIVQAPNVYLNTLFIMNMRRSGTVSEAVPFKLKYGTSMDDINIFRERALQYVRAERRDFRPNCLIEVTGLSETNEVCINAVVFYKSNGQDETLHMQRRTKFLCALMDIARDSNLEGSRLCFIGSRPATPVYATGALASTAW